MIIAIQIEGPQLFECTVADYIPSLFQSPNPNHPTLDHGSSPPSSNPTGGGSCPPYSNYIGTTPQWWFFSYYGCFSFKAEMLHACTECASAEEQMGEWWNQVLLRRSSNVWLCPQWWFFFGKDSFLSVQREPTNKLQFPCLVYSNTQNNWYFSVGIIIFLCV